MKDVFEELEAEVAQYAVDRKHNAIELKNLLIANDNLIVECLSQEVFCVATNSELNVARFTEMHVANTTAETRCLALEVELANLRETNNHDNKKELINHFSKLKRHVRKHCSTWDWYNPELEHDWYHFEFFDMYILLNPQQRHQHQAEMNREERIQELTH
nr:hypothetical protein [Tanacetum cinerariifolium]